VVATRTAFRRPWFATSRIGEIGNLPGNVHTMAIEAQAPMRATAMLPMEARRAGQPKLPREEAADNEAPWWGVLY
jgi:hypothetical protein